MPKILLKKVLNDCLLFFVISLLASTLIIWIFQAVNFLDIIIEDGRDHIVYINYSLLNLPKIINRLIPFVVFFSFFYVISKYEINNELVIFWHFGVKKIFFINYFLKFSIIIMLVQLISSSYIVPFSQDKAKSFLRESKINIYDSFIKPKKFNDTLKGITIYSEDKNENDELINIYLRQNKDFNNYTITYAKKGKFIFKNDLPILLLLDGETLSIQNNKITKFKFLQSDFNMNNNEGNKSLYIKTQEMKSTKLMICLIQLSKYDSLNYNRNNQFIENCSKKNLHIIYKELTKRFFGAFYIPFLILLATMVIIKSKENKKFNNFRIIIFLIGIFSIIFSEICLKLMTDSIYRNIPLAIMPLILFLIFYSVIFLKKDNLN